MPKIILKTLFFISCIALSSVQLLAQDSPPLRNPNPPPPPSPIQAVITQLDAAGAQSQDLGSNPAQVIQKQLNQLESILQSSDGDNSPQVFTTHLPNGNIQTIKGNLFFTRSPSGKLLSASSGGSLTTFTYSSSGNLQTITNDSSAGHIVLNYSSSGNLQTATNNNVNGPTTWTYDDNNNVSQVTSPQGTWNYNSKGDITFIKPTRTPLPLEGSQDSSSKSIDFSGQSNSGKLSLK